MEEKKELGKEYPSPLEGPIIEEMVKEMKTQVDRLYAHKEMLRQIHTKMHGCVKAEFRIMDNLPKELKVGIFAEAKKYNAWIRFSNANTRPKPDKKKDIRGMAIKLMGVPGTKILPDEKLAQTQDFLLMSSETFFSRSLIHFRKTLKASTAKSKLPLLMYFLNPMHWGLLRRLIRSMIACKNPLETSYWSTQPYRYGAEDKAVKYFVKPSDHNNFINENEKEDNYLSVNMAQTLGSNEVSFDFFVQFQMNADTMPIEDPTIPWTSKFQKVAEIRVVKQSFNSEAQKEFGEDLSFNAWHSLPVHRPLGSFNRARKVAYEAMTKYRHEKNGWELVEPSASEDFLTTPFKPATNGE